MIIRGTRVTLKPSYEELKNQVHQLKEEVRRLAQAEESLDQSRNRYRCLVETRSDWLWEIDATGRYVYSSPKIHDLLGYAPKKVIGLTPFDFMAEEEARRLAADFSLIVANHRPFALLENVNLHRDGRRVVLETSGVLIKRCWQWG